MTTGSISASHDERKVLASRTRWWNSTGGGSTKRTISAQQSSNSNTKGFGAIKAGDGGQRFKEQWPELDAENWKWMEENKIDPQTGKSLLPPPASCSPETAALRRRASGSTGGLEAVVEGGRGVAGAGEGFLRRNALYIVIGALFAYVVLARLLGEQK